MLSCSARPQKLEPPEDKSICTLFVGGITPDISEVRPALLAASARASAGCHPGQLVCVPAECALPGVTLALGRALLPLQPTSRPPMPRPATCPRLLRTHLSSPSSPCPSPFTLPQNDIRDAFYSHGELRSVKKVDSRSCAFVTYTTRAAAEAAADALGGK